MNVQKNIFTWIIAMGLMISTVHCALAYEVAVGLGSHADESATIAMADRSQWPVVAELSWGPLANLYPIGTLPYDQQQAVFNNFSHRRAITELPFTSIQWESRQADIVHIESFGLSVPYVFVLYEYEDRVREQGKETADALKAAGVFDSMLTRDEIIRLKEHFPDRKIIMNTRSWKRNKDHIQKVQDLVDGICIEFMPINTPAYVQQDIAPFAVWAYENKKDLLLLMPPAAPKDFVGDRFVRSVTQSAQAIYDANVNILPRGWMKNDNIIFVPANYCWGPPSELTYIPEDGENTVLAAVKSLLMMRPQLEAGPVKPQNENRLPDSIRFLLQQKETE